MHRTPRFFSSLTFSLFALLSLHAFSQARMEGTVKFNGKPLQGADVVITNSAGDEKALVSNSAGAFSYNFPANDEFSVSVSKVGFTSFQISYSTMGLSGSAAKSLKSTVHPEAELFELPSDQGTISRLNAIFDKALLSYTYNSEKNTIEADESMETSLAGELIKASKIAGVASSTIETSYKNLIAKGDAAVQVKNYDLAKNAYNEALGIKPGEAYPKSRLAEIDKMIADADAKAKADAAEKDRLAKEKAAADLAAKQKADADKAAAELAAKDKAEKDKAAADLAAKQKADADKAAADLAAAKKAEQEKAAAEQAEKDRIAKEAADTEKARIAKEKADADKVAADAAEAARVAKEKEKADALAAEKAAADKAEQERLAREKEKSDAIAAEKEKAEKAAAEQAEKDRLAKEAEQKALNDKYDAAIAKGDEALKAENFDLAKTSYAEAQSLKPKETLPADKIKAADDAAEAKKKSQYANEYAKKYKEGVTEEKVKDGNMMVTRRIVVKGNQGNLYEKKETSFGQVYFFKDGVTITEAEFNKNTDIK
ncbi:MAG: carboxypeptidase-like regulatory domain-containing protein [Bacteroidia bacterium]